MTSKVLMTSTSKDTTLENRGETSTTEIGRLTSLTLEVSMTTAPEIQSKTSSRTSTQETIEFSQNWQTQTMETTRESQTNTLTQVTTSTLSSSSNGHTLTETISKDTSHSGKTTTSSTTVVNNTTLMTTEVLTTTTTSADVAPQNTREKSKLVMGSIVPYTSAVLLKDIPEGQSIATSSRTSTQETSASSQSHQTQSTETTREPETSALTQLIISTLPSSQYGHHLSGTISSAIVQIGHTEPTQTAEESETMRLLSPMTDTIKKVTTTASSFIPSGHSPSGSVPQHASTTGEVTTSTLAPSGDGHTTQATTTGLWAAPTSPDIPLEPLGGTSPSVTGTIPQVTTGVSTSGGPGGQLTLPSASTSPDVTPAVTQTHQTQGTETSGETQTSKQASSMSDTISPGTATPSSSMASGTTTSESVSSETSTSGRITSFSPTPSSDSQTTQGTTEFLSTSTSHDPSPGAMGTVSVIVPSTFSTISKVSTAGRLTGQSTTTSSGTSLQEMSAIPHMPQTWSIGTSAGSETMSSVSAQVTDTFSTVTSPPLSSTPNGHTSPQTETHTLSPSDSRETLISTPFITWSSSTLSTGHTSPLSVTSKSSPSTASSGSPLKTEAPVTTTASLRTDNGRSTVTPLPSTTSQTLPTSTRSTSTGNGATAFPVPPQPQKGVLLFRYGQHVGDRKFVRRAEDFTSPLFEPQIGFPLGSSLRDSLYFTDNGQIIFPDSDYQIFSYPHPLQRRFTGWDPVALVAPFWDDADFSSGWGTTYYQEYVTLYDEHYPLVQQVESLINKFTNSWDYKARWTLKVTWVNAPAYPADWTFRTSTYQAILSTDGSRSYTLFLYQSGSMQWDVTQRPGTSVLMGFSSGDGYFENSPLMSQPLWERYRPDQFLDSNSGLQGLQVYRLHREERPNYRLKCLQWLKSSPQWPRRGRNQISCPCSWQQGLWDLRFQPVSIDRWDWSGRQLCRFSSWQGGVCCSYGPWGELREGWRLQSPWQFDWELEPQDWCCRWNDKPYLCTQYWLRRPRVGCAGYRPPRPAWMFGDPHITTLDGANYTFNGLGDFLLVRAWDRNSSFLLQGRTAQTGSVQATNFIAFAAQYHSSSLGPIAVQWFLEPNDTIRVLLNNQTVTFETKHEDGEDREIFNATGVLLTRNGSMVSASFDGTTAITVTALSNILHASSSLPEEYRNHTEGLLGVWNDNPEDDFRMPNGSTFSRGSSEEALFHYGMTWKINETSLLGKKNDHLPSSFTPVFFSQLSGNKSLDENLVSSCNGQRQCIYDALLTRDTSTGLHTMMLFRRYQEMNATLNQYPPSIHGPHVLEAYRGNTTLFHYTSNAEDVTFSLGNHCTDVKLFENGTLLWTPNSLTPFTLEILARSTKVGLSSVLQPKTVVCNCSKESQCLYNKTSRVGNSSLEVAGCKCDGDTFGHYCERSKDPCEEQCFPNVSCIPGQGCEACPPNLTGDGRHCAALENSFLCQNKSCPVNYCYNHGHCYISQTLGCEPMCTCPPAFTDTRCFLAGNNFTPTMSPELPLRVIQLSLSEDENASMADVNASVAYRLGTLAVRAFLQNSKVEQIRPPAPASGSSTQHWKVISKFQYRPWGPVIHFLNNQLLDAVVEVFLPQVPTRRWKRSEGSRNNVVFHPISREDVRDEMALNLSTLKTYFSCSGYKGYHMVYSPQSGLTCVSPCSEGYCDHGGQCQHLPDGPRCSCVSFTIYTAWGERCEHLSVKLGAFFGILFGALSVLLLLGAAVFVVLRFWGCSATKYYDYHLDSES
ncbi:PREDICTED: mucin-4 [Propithecus coquereli]|uniref:mucin-4 n=1 Tax=Propithecus coquereli TaxID=379532 RepID=UPI00063F961B|nr:PREDICTED: mucin-4 [Propithecus coquereli]